MIRRSQCIAARQMASTTDKGEQRIFSVTVKVQESDEKQIIKIPRSNQPLAPRNSVRVDKESVEDQIARLQRLQRQQRQQAAAERQTGPLNPATVASKPLWRQPRTRGRQQEEQEKRTRITFAPHTPSAIGAAEFRRQQQLSARQNLATTSTQQVAAIKPAPTRRTPAVPTNTDNIEERVARQVHQRVAAIQQDLEQRRANQIAQLTEDITTEERRRAARREEQTRAAWETEAAELQSQIQRSTARRTRATNQDHLRSTHTFSHRSRRVSSTATTVGPTKPFDDKHAASCGHQASSHLAHSSSSN